MCVQGSSSHHRESAPTPARGGMLNDTAFPSRGALTIAFAHVAYRAAEEFAARRTGVAHFEVRTLEDLERRAREADVLVVSGLWRNTLMARAPKLRFVQSFSAGTDQYDTALFAKRGVRLANAQGVNERAVAEHAIALILALTRQLHLARDNQREALWRGMIGDRALREQELGGKTSGCHRARPHRHASRQARPRLRYACDRGAPHGKASVRRRR